MYDYCSDDISEEAELYGKACDDIYNAIIDTRLFLEKYLNTCKRNNFHADHLRDFPNRHDVYHIFINQSSNGLIQDIKVKLFDKNIM
jgi:hypothetical protein